MDMVVAIGLAGVVCKKAIVDVAKGNVLDTLNVVRVKNAWVVVVCVEDVLVGVSIIFEALVLVDVKIVQVVVLVVVDVICVIVAVLAKNIRRIDVGEITAVRWCILSQ